MARDISIKLNRCTYCGRPGFTVWDSDVVSCGREVCESLAFAEVKRRNRNGGTAPEKRLARALLGALDTLEYELHLDKDELERVCSRAKPRRRQSSGRRGTRRSRPSRSA